MNLYIKDILNNLGSAAERTRQWARAEMDAILELAGGGSNYGSAEKTARYYDDLIRPELRHYKLTTDDYRDIIDSLAAPYLLEAYPAGAFSLLQAFSRLEGAPYEMALRRSTRALAQVHEKLDAQACLQAMYCLADLTFPGIDRRREAYITASLDEIPIRKILGKLAEKFRNLEATEQAKGFPDPWMPGTIFESLLEAIEDASRNVEHYFRGREKGVRYRFNK